MLRNNLFSILLFFLYPVLNLAAQDSIQIVKAEKGDGIYSILRKQGLNPVEYFDDFVKLNQDSIKNGSQLVVGRAYKIPHAPDSTPKMGTEVSLGTGTKYPIFGGDQAFVAPKSKRLEETVYYLISGHGGPDPGAMENYNGTTIAEDEYAYDVTLRLAKELLAHGAKVYVIVRDKNDGIRDDRALELDNDEVVYPDKEIPLNQRKRLEQRVEAVNDLYLKNTDRYQRLIVTHVDSRSKSENIDVFFYYHEKSKNGKKLAESIHTTFQKKYKKFQPYRDYSGTFTDRSNLYMVKNTLPPMAYIEIGNIKNGKDKRRILDPDNRQALAKWISEGILLDYEGQ
ncbi:MAG: N-acetylmuramoyl-L-alanine amidase family protein [Flavobacteriaceae bacterium]